MSQTSSSSTNQKDNYLFLKDFLQSFIHSLCRSQIIKEQDCNVIQKNIETACQIKFNQSLNEMEFLMELWFQTDDWIINNYNIFFGHQDFSSINKISGNIKFDEICYYFQINSNNKQQQDIIQKNFTLSNDLKKQQATPDNSIQYSEIYNHLIIKSNEFTQFSQVIYAIYQISNDFQLSLFEANQDLKQLIMDFQNQVDISYSLMLFINKYLQNYNVKDEQDAFEILLNVLYSLKSQKNTVEYKRNFIIQYSDGLTCEICKKYNQKFQDGNFYHLEEKVYEVGIETKSLDLMFSIGNLRSQQKYYNKQLINCGYCQQANLHTLTKTCQKLPHFLFVKNLTSQNFNVRDLDNNYTYTINEEQKLTYKYQIIGVSLLNSKKLKYTYAMIVDSKWMQFNDTISNVQLDQNIQPHFFVMKQIS